MKKEFIYILYLTIMFSSCIDLPSTAFETNEAASATPSLQVIEITSTTIPIIEATQAKKDPPELTLELIRTNNGCELPCWWGIAPGQSITQSNLDFLRSFSIVTIKRSPKWVVYSVRSPIDEMFSDFGELRFLIATQEDIVKEIQIEGFNEESFHLSNFLQRVGKPDTILISSYSSDSGASQGLVPLTIALYYPKIGILALYGSWANVSGDNIYGCFTTGPTLFLWSTESSNAYSIEYFLSWEKQGIPFLAIQDATSLTVEDIYSNYSNQEAESCLQSPTNLWPSQ